MCPATHDPLLDEMAVPLRNVSKTHPNVLEARRGVSLNIPPGERDVSRRKREVRRTLGYPPRSFGFPPKAEVERLPEHFGVAVALPGRRWPRGRGEHGRLTTHDPLDADRIPAVCNSSKHEGAS